MSPETKPDTSFTTHPATHLVNCEGRLCLESSVDPSAGRLWVDFTDPGLTYRRRQALRHEALVKAVGGCRRSGEDAAFDNSLIDATAGLGQDAFILACAGWHVTLIEQSPQVHALLADGLQRALAISEQGTDEQLRTALRRMQLLAVADSSERLQELDPVAVIYLDPMFPEREKSARVKKNRFLLQQLHGPEARGEGLLEQALRRSRKVVVKRPRLAPVLDGCKPSADISGKTSRFDIYAGRVSG